eukprot:1445276-Alexandrium_andersonii.AAC.1
MSASLVGSEMCIRDRLRSCNRCPSQAPRAVLPPASSPSCSASSVQGTGSGALGTSPLSPHHTPSRDWP